MKNWEWDRDTKTKANGLQHVLRTFGNIINFIVAKSLLEPMRPLHACREVYFGFQKVEEVKKSYKHIRAGIDDRFDQMYEEVLRLAELVGAIDSRPRFSSRQLFRENTPAESTRVYWKRTVAIPFLDVVCKEITARFSEETRAHFELCVC